MKKNILPLLLALLASLSPLAAQISPTVSVQGTNATLRWASTPGESYVVLYRRAFHPEFNWTVIGTNVPAWGGIETFFQHTGGVPRVPAGVGGGGGDGGGSSPPVLLSATSPTTDPTKDKDGKVKAKDNALPAFPTLPDEKALEKWLKELHKEYERQQREGGGVPAFTALMASTLTAEQATNNSMGYYAVSRSTDDSDGDGIPDGYEAQHGLLPLTHDSMLDQDGDGWANLDEYLLGMNPLVPDAGPSTFAVAVTSGAASESGPTPGTFTVSRTGDLTRAVTVYLGWGGTARAGRDYTRLTNEITFASGQASFVLTVVPVNDTEFEGTETVTLKVYPDLAYAVGVNTEATLNLLDNDLPGVSVIATKPDAAEAGPTHGEFEFRRTGSVASNLTVNFNLTGSTAANGADFTTIATSILIPAGANATNLPITVINDTAFEGTETVVLNLTDHASYSVSNRTATVTIADNDLPVVTVTATDADAREAGPNPGQFTFSRTGSTAAALRVNYGIGGTATNGVDYQLITNFVTIPAGAPSITLTLTPIADGVVEFLEFVTLTLRGSDLYDIGAANSGTVFIDDSTASTPAVYGWRMLRGAAVYTNAPNIDAPAIIEIYRRGSTAAAASFPFAVYTNAFLANPLHYTVTGDISGSSVVFGVNKTNAFLYVKNTLASPLVSQSPSGVIVTVPALFGTGSQQPFFLRSFYFISSLDWTTTVGLEPGTLTLRATRLVPGPALAVPVRLSGLANPSDAVGADHNTPSITTLFIPNNALTGDLTVTASNDGVLEGWESVVANIDSPQGNQVAASLSRRISFFRDNVPDPSLLTDGDTDADGLPDHWEIQYGFDPTVADDTTLDTDKDGLNLLDEFIFGTHPTNAATFGTNDYRYSRVTNTVDAVPIRLIVGDTGKHNNGQGCAVCHITALQVGTTRIKSETRAQLADRLVNFEKGKSYPVRLLDILGILSPVTGNLATPATTAKYTAQILPADPAVPTFLLTDPQAILGTNKTWAAGAFTNTNAVVIVPKLQLTWTHLADNLPIETNTVPGTNTLMPGGGFRVFVGAKTPTETNPRNTVILKVKSIPSLPGRTVYLKSFDVDDATDDAFDTAGVIDTNGLAGNDNFTDYLGTPQAGAFGSGTSSTSSAVLDANGEALVQFRVGMQPGNNYRIAATVQATNNLASLQVTNPTNAFFVAAGTNGVPNFNGDMSPMLTVWRKLHLEIDSMPAPPASGAEQNYVTGFVYGHTTNNVAAGQTRIWLRGDTQLADRNRFENGWLIIAGLSPLRVIASETYAVVVAGTVATNILLQTFSLQDDDDSFLADLGLPPPLPMNGRSGQIVQGMQPAFTYAFLQLVDANQQAGWNPRPVLPAFYRNIGMGVTDGNGGVYATAKDIYDSQVFWANTISFGYQPFTSEDADPDNVEGTLKGITAKRNFPYVGGVSAIFVETIRDTAQNFNNQTLATTNRVVDYWGWIYGICAHETAHTPGNQSESDDHKEEGLMTSDGMRIPSFKPEEVFSPRTLLRIRKAPRWNN